MYFVPFPYPYIYLCIHNNNNNYSRIIYFVMFELRVKSKKNTKNYYYYIIILYNISFAFIHKFFAASAAIQRTNQTTILYFLFCFCCILYNFPVLLLLFHINIFFIKSIEFSVKSVLKANRSSFSFLVSIVIRK